MPNLLFHGLEGAVFDRAAEALRRGEVVIFPTETVYGVGVSAAVPEADERLRRVKGRAEDKPFQRLVADTDGARNAGARLGPGARALAERFWPGPLTLVVPAGPPAEAPWIGVRVPDHAGLRALIGQCGGALVASSANRAGEPEPRTVEEAVRALGGRVDLALDGGPAREGRASTVLRLDEDDERGPARFTVLRAGAISEVQIRAVLGPPLTRTPPGLD